MTSLQFGFSSEILSRTLLLSEQTFFLSSNKVFAVTPELLTLIRNVVSTVGPGVRQVRAGSYSQVRLHGWTHGRGALLRIRL